MLGKQRLDNARGRRDKILPTHVQLGRGSWTGSAKKNHFIQAHCLRQWFLFRWQEIESVDLIITVSIYGLAGKSLSLFYTSTTSAVDWTVHTNLNEVEEKTSLGKREPGFQIDTRSILGAPFVRKTYLNRQRKFYFKKFTINQINLLASSRRVLATKRLHT